MGPNGVSGGPGTGAEGLPAARVPEVRVSPSPAELAQARQNDIAATKAGEASSILATELRAQQQRTPPPDPGEQLAEIVQASPAGKLPVVESFDAATDQPVVAVPEGVAQRALYLPGSRDETPSDSSGEPDGDPQVDGSGSVPAPGQKGSLLEPMSNGDSPGSLQARDLHYAGDDFSSRQASEGGDDKQEGGSGQTSQSGADEASAPGNGGRNEGGGTPGRADATETPGGIEPPPTPLSGDQQADSAPGSSSASSLDGLLQSKTMDPTASTGATQPEQNTPFTGASPAAPGVARPGTPDAGSPTSSPSDRTTSAEGETPGSPATEPPATAAGAGGAGQGGSNGEGGGGIAAGAAGSEPNQPNGQPSGGEQSGQRGQPGAESGTNTAAGGPEASAAAVPSSPDSSNPAATPPLSPDTAANKPKTLAEQIDDEKKAARENYILEQFNATTGKGKKARAANEDLVKALKNQEYDPNNPNADAIWDNLDKQYKAYQRDPENHPMSPEDYADYVVLSKHRKKAESEAAAAVLENHGKDLSDSEKAAERKKVSEGYADDPSRMRRGFDRVAEWFSGKPVKEAHREYRGLKGRYDAKYGRKLLKHRFRLLGKVIGKDWKMKEGELAQAKLLAHQMGEAWRNWMGKSARRWALIWFFLLGPALLVFGPSIGAAQFLKMAGKAGQG